MKMFKIAIVVFDQFTDIDYFLMRDILGRNSEDWAVSVLGTKECHISSLGQQIKTDGRLEEANHADVVLFISGQKGVPAVLADKQILSAFKLDATKQLIGSICAGSFILHALGLLTGIKATTHPDANAPFKALGIEPEYKPIVIQGNIATAGGCLSALYLTGWVAERLFDKNKRREIHRQLIPTGQEIIFEDLIVSTLANAD